MDTTAQNRGRPDTEAWRRLLRATQECEQLFEKIKEDVDNEKILPRVGLGIIQQMLPPRQNHSTLPKVLSDRLAQIRKRDISILVAGEVSSGKSTFLNILMGGSYLPMSFLETTKVVCELRHHPIKRNAILKFKDQFINDVILDLPEDSGSEIWKTVGQCIRTEKYENKHVERIVILWPQDVVKEIFGSEILTAIGSDRGDGRVRSPNQSAGTHHAFDPNFVANLDKQYAASFRETAENDVKIDQDLTALKEVYRAESDETVTPQERQHTAFTDQTNKIQDIKTQEATGGTNQADAEFENGEPHSHNVDTALETSDSRGDANDPIGDTVDEDTKIGVLRNVTSDTKPDIRGTPSVTVGTESESGDPCVDAADTEPETHGTRSDTIDLYRGSVTLSLERTSDNASVSSASSTRSLEDDHLTLTFLDCPGIKDHSQTETFIPTLANVASCRAFIFIIGVRGVEETRLQALMNDIEDVLQAVEVELNPDCSLFIINQVDLLPEEERDTFRASMVDKLRSKWPLISEKNIVEMEAKSVLSEVTSGCQEARKPIYAILNDFLLAAVQLSLEEHCLWLLNFLETAHAFAKGGKHWVGIVESRRRMDDKLRDLHEQAVNLHESVFECNEDAVNEEVLQQLKNIIQDATEKVIANEWQLDEIEANIKNDNTEWFGIARTIEKMIIDVLKSTQENNIKTLQQKHAKEIAQLFKKQCHDLASIEEMLYGMIPSTLSDGSVDARGCITMLLPAAIGGALRIAPPVFPFLFLAVPLLPVPLLLASLVDEVRSYRRTVQREEYRRNKVEYFKKRAREICANAGNIRHDSEIFKHIFGESFKQQLHERIVDILELIKFLLNCSLQETTQHKKVCSKHIIETIEVYTRHVLSHEIAKANLVFVEENGVTKRIGGGGQGNVFEAKLKGEFRDEVVAVKEFHCMRLPNRVEESLPAYLEAYRECFMLRQLSRKNNKNLVKFYGTSAIYENGELHFRLVLERCYDSLNWLILDNWSKNEQDDKMNFLHHAAECTAGLMFLHENNVLHRDIKPENFLLRQKLERGKYRIVICDIGSGKLIYQNCTAGIKVGSIAYHAPELISPHAFHTRKSDIYSLGLVLWELAFHRHIAERLRTVPVMRKREMPKDNDIKAVVSACLHADPKKRPGAHALMKIIEERRPKET